MIEIPEVIALRRRLNAVELLNEMEGGVLGDPAIAKARARKELGTTRAAISASVPELSTEELDRLTVAVKRTR